MLWASFPPLDWWPLAWVALVPLLLLIGAQPRPKLLYPWVYLGGLAFWLAAIQWMRLGDATMYVGWIALSIYLACYLPAFVWLTRVAVDRLHLPLEWSAAVVWTGLELARAHVMSGFAWYYLGHTQYPWITLIQVSDLVGAYGVSFLVVLVAGCGVALLGEREVQDRPVARFRPRLVLPGVVLFAVLVYGWVRQGQAEFRLGPKVALLQGNIAQDAKLDPGENQRVFRHYFELLETAALAKPDLIVWPETMFRSPLVSIDPAVTDDDLRRHFPEAAPEFVTEDLRVLERDVPEGLTYLARHSGTAVLIGIDAHDVSTSGVRRYNSTVLVTDAGIRGRYDKVHRVPFGEFLPLAHALPWLVHLTPFPEGYGIDAGSEAVRFELDGYHFATIICFEDTVPHLVRRVLNEARPAVYPPADAAPSNTSGDSLPPLDFLVNQTNDGWFHGSSELDQHLITGAFRSVECRIPTVRAVNTGISAVIDGNGRFVRRAHDPATGKSKQVAAVLVEAVPLDDRASLYVRFGDWFAGLCLLACGGLAVGSLALPAPSA
jgi:apolipoprotein N-acyltransferase